MFIRPILERPKSVSLMWPIDVINKLLGERRRQCKRRILQFVKKMRIRAELQKNQDYMCPLTDPTMSTDPNESKKSKTEELSEGDVGDVLTCQV